jgi:hypothetical protein
VYFEVMEQSKHMDLLLLITIRDNDKIPTDEFYKLFDNNWDVYSSRFRELTFQGLFINSSLVQIPGRFRYELTKKGKLRITELLNERSNEIEVKQAELKHVKDSIRVTRKNISLRITGFIRVIFSRFTSKPQNDKRLTVNRFRPGSSAPFVTTELSNETK